MIVTRCAPSPTGRLHLGHAWSAVEAHDRAREAGGGFLLRIEDIDGTRSRPGHVRGIVDDMTWLGLAWDGPVVCQSQRAPLYAEALDRLHAGGLTYRCFCTRSDIAAGSAPHDDDQPQPHPATCRHRPAAEVEARLAAGEAFSWRLDMTAAIDSCRKTTDASPAANSREREVAWHDEIAGPQVATPEIAGDVVLWRKDAPASYHLAVTVDDAAQGVTHVVRGRDLFAATHVHRLLQALLDLPVPVYRHHALLVDADGRRLAKRRGAPTLAELRGDWPDGRVLADALRAGDLPNGYRTA